MTPRVLLSKIGLDGHDRGALIVARALRDAGMEVVYLGMRQTVESIVAAARQEDPDVLGISVLSNVQLQVAPRLVAAMRAAGLDDIPLILGGTIAAEEIPSLQAAGVAAVFPTGAALDEIVAYCRAAAQRRAMTGQGAAR